LVDLNFLALVGRVGWVANRSSSRAGATALALWRRRRRWGRRLLCGTEGRNAECTNADDQNENALHDHVL
jgi:hypothetical protein